MLQSTNKQYFWELLQYKQCDSDRYRQMTTPQRTYLYLYKKNNVDVVARIPEPTQKVHGWAFQQIQIFQKLNDNPRVSHWKMLRIPFKGELILSILPSFNKSLIFQIEQNLPKRTTALTRWMNQQLDDVYSIKLRRAETFGYYHQFIEVKTVYRTRYKNYFEIKGWKENSWQGLLQIAEAQKMQVNNSYATLLQEINQFIQNYEVARQSKYENMFILYAKEKARKEIKDKHQLQYENTVMRKYNLQEYVEKG